MKGKLLVLLAVLIVLASAVVVAKELYIAMISKGFQHQFWQAVKQGAEQAGRDFGVRVTFEGPETEAMIDKQIEMFLNALARKPDAIGLAALDAKALIPYVEMAAKQGIPVICFDSGVESDIPLTTVATNNIEAAAHAADRMASLIGYEGKIAVIVHDPVSRTGIERRDGFVNRIKEKYPNIQIVAVEYGGGDHLRSADIAKAIITAHPDLKGFFGANEGSAVGIVLAVRELRMQGKIVVVGYDAGKHQLDAIREGLMAGAITQNPVGMGYKAVEAAIKAIRGEKLPKFIDSGFYWYDKTNIDAPILKPLLYQ